MPKPSTLTPEQYAQVASTFDALLEQELTGEAALELIQREAGADEVVVASLRAMLAAHESELAAGDDEGLQASALEAVSAEVEAADDSMTRAMPRTIGPYEVVRFMASGGMGTVYEAMQSEPRRRVAIKVIRFELLSPDTVKRFEAEGHLLARLRHEGIAQVFTMGRTRTPSGTVPYLVLEYVDGTLITDHVREHDLGTEARLKLLRKVCSAVQYAHDNGVLHRDLKPGNILVDRDGQPRVLDFGIARSFDDAEHQATLTASGMFLGTLAYMSPEQAVRTSAPLDVRVDVYGIGAVGYEVMTGQPPHDIRGMPIHEAVARVSRHDPRPLASQDTAFAGDLSAIFSKALATDRERRYRSVHEFDEDLRRLLEHEPVEARAPSALYQVRKLVRRNRLTFGLLTLVVLSLVVGLGLALRERRAALDAQDSAQQIAREAQRERRAATLQAAWTALEAGRVDAASEFLATEASEGGGIELRLMRARAYGAATLQSIDAVPGRVACISPDARYGVTSRQGGAARRIDLATGDSLALLPEGYELPARRYAFVDGAPALLAAQHAATIDVIDVAARRLIGTLQGEARRIAPSQRSRRLVVERSSPTHPEGRLWDIEQRALVHDERLAALREGALALDVSHGRYLAQLRASTGLEIVDLDSYTLRRLDVSIAEYAQTPLLSADGRFLIHRLSSPVVYDFERGDRFHLGGQSTGVLADAVLHEDGRTLAILDLDGRVTLWDLAARRPTFTARDARLTALGVQSQRHRRSGGAIRFRPEERGLYTISGNKLATWFTQNQATRMDHAVDATPFPHVYALAWHPGGRWLASAAWDDRVVIWDTWTGQRAGALDMRAAHRSLAPGRPTPPVMETTALTWSPDGQTLAAYTWRGFCACWSVWQRKLSFAGYLGAQLVAVENGPFLLTEGEQGAARRLAFAEADVGEPHAVTPVRAARPPSWAWADARRGAPRAQIAFGFAAAGQRVAAGRHSHEGAVDAFSVWERGRSEPLWSGAITGDALAAELADDGRRLLIGTRAGTIQIHDIDLRLRLMVMHAHDDYIITLALAPDGSSLASGSGDGWVRLDPLAPVGERMRRAASARAQRARLLPIVRRALAGAAGGAEATRALLADEKLDPADRLAAQVLLFSLRK